MEKLVYSSDHPNNFILFFGAQRIDPSIPLTTNKNNSSSDQCTCCLDHNKYIRPLLIIVHGGLWLDGSPYDYQMAAEYASKHLGLNVAVIGYPLSDGKGESYFHPDHTVYVARAISFLFKRKSLPDEKGQIRGLPENIQFCNFHSFYFGHSVGASMISLLIFNRDYFQQNHVTDIQIKNNKTNSLKNDNNNNDNSLVLPIPFAAVSVQGLFYFKRFTETHSEWSSTLHSVVGGSDPSKWMEPIHFLDAKYKTSNQNIKTHWLFFFSKEDPWVSYDQTGLFVDRLMDSCDCVISVDTRIKGSHKTGVESMGRGPGEDKIFPLLIKFLSSLNVSGLPIN